MARTSGDRMHVALKIGVGLGIVGGGALVLRACGGPPDAEGVAKDLLDSYDRNDDKAIDRSEATHQGSRYTGGGYRFDALDATKLLEAADSNSDDRASLTELTSFVEGGDANHDGKLLRSEVGELMRDVSPRVSSFTIGG